MMSTLVQSKASMLDEENRQKYLTKKLTEKLCYCMALFIEDEKRSTRLVIGVLEICGDRLLSNRTPLATREAKQSRRKNQ